MRRCFVALAVDDRTAERLAAVQKQALAACAAAGIDGVRATTRQNLHLTVKFLGQVTEPQLETLGPALAEVARRTTLPPIHLAGVGAFPSSDEPRAVFAAVTEGRRAVIDLGAAVDRAVAPLGFAPDDQARSPHVTLLRNKRDGCTPLGRWLATQDRRPLGEVRHDALLLYESELRPEGSRYTALARFAFAGAMDRGVS